MTLDPIPKSGERIKIKDFLAIRAADVMLGDVTVFVGPQASGKSVIAKIVYFGREYIQNYLSDILGDDFSLRSFKAHRSDSFVDLFNGLSGYGRPFDILYDYSGLSVRIYRQSEASKPKITHSENLTRVGSALKKKFEAARSDARSKKVSFYTSYRFLRQKENLEFANSIPKSLFIPAARSFYSAVSDNIFSFLAAEERVDSLTVQFGEFYQYARARFNGEYGASGDMKKHQADVNSKLRPVLDGSYQRSRSNDLIRTKWGDVPVRAASSGQQEALPLLLSLAYYPLLDDGEQLLIIEEPEAHLFPTAQKYVLEMMMDAPLSGRGDLLFTTHSPYMLNYLNAYVPRNILAGKKSGCALRISAYYCNDGSVASINDDDGFIDVGELDAVSGEIVTEIMKALP